MSFNIWNTDRFKTQLTLLVCQRMQSSFMINTPVVSVARFVCVTVSESAVQVHTIELILMRGTRSCRKIIKQKRGYRTPRTV
jgi:hypothetical protein